MRRVTFRRHRNACRSPAAALAAAALYAASAAAQAPEDRVEQGRYLLQAAGCTTCHTAKGGEPLAGGRALDTPFGTFHTPNITPDPETGIGGWTDAEFVAALRHGTRPDGAAYYPAFPYTTYTRMREADALAIKAYLDSLPPVRNPVPDHALDFPFSLRILMRPWRLLFFDDAAGWAPPAGLGEQAQRGAYLVEALAHCGECHTPRNAFGALDRDRAFAGTPDGPDGEKVPNITPDPETGIGDWSEADIVYLLREGLKPNFDDVQGSMAEAVRDGLRHLTDEDLQAIAAYLKSIPPVRNRVAAPE